MYERFSHYFHPPERLSTVCSTYMTCIYLKYFYIHTQAVSSEVHTIVRNVIIIIITVNLGLN